MEELHYLGTNNKELLFAKMQLMNYAFATFGIEMFQKKHLEDVIGGIKKWLIYIKIDKAII